MNKGSGEREDLDDEFFDLEKYEAEFDLEEELKAPIEEDEDDDHEMVNDEITLTRKEEHVLDLRKKAIPVTTKKKTAKKKASKKKVDEISGQTTVAIDTEKVTEQSEIAAKTKEMSQDAEKSNRKAESARNIAAAAEGAAKKKVTTNSKSEPKKETSNQSAEATSKVKSAEPATSISENASEKKTLAAKKQSDKETKDINQEEVHESTDITAAQLPPVQPSYQAIAEEDDGGWWIAVLIILILVAAGVVYNYSLTQTPVDGTVCTEKYLESFAGQVIWYDSGTTAAQTWLRQALHETESENAEPILRLVACEGDAISAESVPESNTCVPEPTRLVLSQVSLEDVIGQVEVRSCSETESGMLLCGEEEINPESENYFETEDGRERGVLIVTDDSTRLNHAEDVEEPSLIIFRNPGMTEHWYFTVEAGDEDTLAVRLFAGDATIEGMTLKYVTTEPRLVTYEYS